MIKQYVKKERKHVYVKKGIPGIATVKEKVGMMVAFVKPNEPNQILIGFSKCHIGLDEFDWNLGEQIAMSRALYYHRNKKTPKVPDSMKRPLKKFAIRVSKYYKNAEPPSWITYL